MKFGFVTCVKLGYSCIKKIYDLKGRLDLIITLHDGLAKNKSGRIYLDEYCKDKSIDLLKIKNINESIVIDYLRKYEIDWLFIIGWSQIAKKELLDTPRLGILGMHPTLLPQGRGRASIPWAILKNLDKTGVTLFKLDEGIDTGEIIYQEKVSICPFESAETLYNKINSAHETLISKVWPLLVNDEIKLYPQDETRASIWNERKPSDGEITTNMSVYEVEKLVRATTRPYPGAFIQERDRIIKIWRGIIGNQNENSPANALNIKLVDGIYYALDYDIIKNKT